MLIVGQVLLLSLFCVVLVKSTEVIVGAVKKLVRRSRVGSFGVAVLPLLLIADLTLSKADGVVLLLYFAFGVIEMGRV